MKQNPCTPGIALSAYHFALAALLLLWLPQPSRSQQGVLDRYVAEALQNNLALRQHATGMERSHAALDEAKRLYFPSLDLSARYSRAGGGRLIEVPIGDLLNPVYSTLNAILESQGIPGTFPQVENQVVPFLREREQETRLRLIQPLVQPAISHTIALRSHLVRAGSAGLEAYKRRLVAEVKTAYFMFLKAESAVDVYESAARLVAENLRVHERLLANGKVTRDAVFRAETEVRVVEQDLERAVADRDLSASWFNFLLNRPLDAPITIPEPESLDSSGSAGSAEWTVPDSAGLAEDWSGIALDRREELEQLDFAIRAAQAAGRIESSSRLPTLAAAVDIGVQGESYILDRDSDYWMASIVLNWSLFDGMRRRSRVTQAELERKRLEEQREELARQVALETARATSDVRVAVRALETARQRLASARQTYRLVQRKVEEGMANQIEFLDARTTLTSAELNLVITRYDLLIHMAELERSAALYVLPTTD